MSTKKDERARVHLGRRGSLTDTDVSSPWVKPLDLNIQTHGYLSAHCIIISLSGVDRKAVGIGTLPQIATALGICWWTHERTEFCEYLLRRFQYSGLYCADRACDGTDDAALGSTVYMLWFPIQCTKAVPSACGQSGKVPQKVKTKPNMAASRPVAYFPHTCRLFPTL